MRAKGLTISDAVDRPKWRQISMEADPGSTSYQYKKLFLSKKNQQKIVYY